MTDKRYSEQQLVFLGYLQDEAKGDFYKAMELAGYNRSYASTLRRVLKEELATIALELMAGSAVSAAFSMQDLMDNPNQPGAPIKLKAATEFLNRAGIQKTEESTIKVPTTGLFILPAKGSSNGTEGEDA